MEQTTKSTSNLHFLQGGGETGELIRNYDWSQTSLGTPDTWPQSLRTALGIVISSSFPMLLWWGNELIQFYNDAFRPSLGNEGKHPLALGKPAIGYWKENWHIIKPLIDKVMIHGEPSYFENLPIPNYRNGRIEEVYWTFSYSPVRDESGAPAAVLMTCFETTEQVTQRRKIEESEGRFRRLVEEAPVAMFIFRGKNMVINTANKMALQMISRTETVIGLPLLEAIPELKASPAYKVLQDVYHTGQAQYGQEVLVPLERAGILEDCYFNFVYTPLLENGQVVGVMDVATEVTDLVLARKKIEDVVAQRTQELEKANQALQDTNKELQRSNHHLEEFAHAASHDLKEPVRKILFFANQLKNQLSSQLKDAEVNSINRIEAATQRMGALIDDLLLYSHVSQLPHEKETVDLTEKVKRVLEDLELDIQEKGAMIDVEDLPTVAGYPRQLQQLFQNLISNAIKYSKAGISPQIKIQNTQVKEAGRNYYVIEVKDNGIGFEPEYTEKIFQIFARLHGRHEYSGTGVGLSIAKKVVENHNGFIQVESEPGRGSTFNVYLPVE